MAKKTALKTFTVHTKEIYHVYYVIKATSAEDAKNKILNGESEDSDLGDWHDYANEPKDWNVTEEY